MTAKEKMVKVEFLIKVEKDDMRTDSLIKKEIKKAILDGVSNVVEIPLDSEITVIIE
jgi:hypothetical protein